MPAISPNSPAASSYTISNSRAFVVNSQLDFNNVPRSFTVSYPDPAPAGLTVTLVRVTAPGGSVDLDALATAGTVDSASIAGRDVSATRSSSGGVTQLTCNIQDPSEAGVLDEHYEVRVSATAAVTWGYAVDNAFNSNVIRLVCDPVAAYNGLPATLLEKQLLTVTAQGAAGPALTPTVVRNTNPANGLVLPAPVPTYQFGHQGTIAIQGLPSPVGTSQTYQLTDAFLNPVPLPGVYAPTPVTFTVDVVYPGIGGPAFLTGHGTGAASITPRPQRVQLILDRSGSMGAEHRWDNAKTAARIFVNFFGEFRDGVNADDRIGITVFEDNVCSFRSSGPAGPPFITDVVPLGTPAAVAAADLSGPVFGNPGGCTPIGDGLFFGLQKLEAAGFPTNVRYTVVLLTDGDENAGTIKIGPGADPGNPKTWAAAKLDPAIDQITGPTTDLNLFTIGLGSAPNFTVLNNLAAAGHFAAAFTVGTLIDQFATMFSLSQEANKLLTRFTRVVGDPVPPAPLTEVFFDTSNAQKFGVAILKTLDPPTPADVIDTVEIARWDGTTFVVEKIVPADFEGHFYLGVPDAGAFNGGTATWRVRRFHGAAVKPIALEDVFAFEDLHVKSALALDRKDYLTGDEMQLAVEIRKDFAPVRGATVRAVLDAPAEGIGSLLAGLDPDDVARQQRRKGDGKDRPRGRGALIDAVLEKYDWDGLPRCNPDPGGLFVDGTDLLHDVDGDGIYTNTFAKVHVEGVYNWTLFVNGVDDDGNPFSHRLDRSTLAAISVSRKATVIRRETLKIAEPSLTAVKVTITPQDDFKELLGPGFDDTVIWAISSEGGVFAHVRDQQPPPVNTDGTYTRTVVFKRGTKPTLRVSVNGVILPKIYLAPGQPAGDWRHPRTSA
ncbi:vWA domain-containing protein [Micromonospora auratinigra]|uniref:von Willebrand factor type A domain-containing protein n=1 Tax=Micromonospora auratinigra TaxID=261654 RepID=A0A1A8ZH40_9ACTN|nr:vWA domain-containing protein [Micromonospora auratinigra]SBT43195.1 von Willebrand factor type A domain-containing protein [Micromonospora auratinigra]